MTVRNGSDGGPLLTPAFITLTLSELAYFTALGLMIPVVPLFATDSLAVGSAAVGVAIGAFSIKDLSGAKDTLTKWMGAVDADLPVLRSFTAGLRRDLDAVVAGLTLEYNSGAVEGTVNRIKQLKTAMYGRAKPDLLRKLILLA